MSCMCVRGRVRVRGGENTQCMSSVLVRGRKGRGKGMGEERIHNTRQVCVCERERERKRKGRGGGNNTRYMSCRMCMSHEE